MKKPAEKPAEEPTGEPKIPTDNLMRNVAFITAVITLLAAIIGLIATVAGLAKKVEKTEELVDATIPPVRQKYELEVTPKNGKNHLDVDFEVTKPSILFATISLGAFRDDKTAGQRNPPDGGEKNVSADIVCKLFEIGETEPLVTEKGHVGQTAYTVNLWTPVNLTAPIKPGKYRISASAESSHLTSGPDISISYFALPYRPTKPEG
ncbi:MAG: hypothetical protein H7A53_08000 [Akkermansiaceae bacterium]|nr:hypothetical protein [Akkermansiaceae bacterium]MCP5550816.1 hypothetical protein [Akkermansiaceae bacterium]